MLATHIRNAIPLFHGGLFGVNFGGSAGKFSN